MPRTKGSETNQDDIFSNVEYLEVSYNKETLITFPGKEVEGKSKFEVQKMVGDKFGTKMYTGTRWKKESMHMSS